MLHFPFLFSFPSATKIIISMTGTKILLSASFSLQKHTQQHFVTIDQKHYNNSVQHSLHRHIHLSISGISVCYESWRVGVRLPGASFCSCHHLQGASFYNHLHSLHTPQVSWAQSPFFPFLSHLILHRLPFLTYRIHLLPDTTFLGPSSAKASNSLFGPSQTDGDVPVCSWNNLPDWETRVKL